MDSEKLGAREARTLAKLKARADAIAPLSQEMLDQLAERRGRKSPIERAERLRVNWRHQANKRYAAKLHRTPTWADLMAIRALHEEASRLTLKTGIGHHVDHIIPPQGKLVSGLHVHTNMQILTASENSKKWNRFEP